MCILLSVVTLNSVSDKKKKYFEVTRKMKFQEKKEIKQKRQKPTNKAKYIYYFKKLFNLKIKNLFNSLRSDDLL